MSGIVGAATTTTGVIVNVSDDGKSDFIEVKQEDLSAAPVGGGSSTNQAVVANSGAAEDQEEEGNLMIVDDAGTHSTSSFKSNCSKILRLFRQMAFQLSAVASRAPLEFFSTYIPHWV